MKLTVQADAAFKICQITDIHLGTFPLKEEDKRTLAGIDQVLTANEFDLIMVTGDLIWGKINEAPKESLAELFKVLNRSGVPVALTYGNHDAEGTFSRSDLRNYENMLVNPATKENPFVINDRENYTLDIYQDEGVRNRIFVWDSGDYFNSAVKEGYATLEPEQVIWFNKHAAERATTTTDLAFMHIPLAEYYLAADHIIEGIKGEKICSGWYSSGLFYAFIKQQNVKALFVGHDHENNYRSQIDGIELSYGNVAGYNTYGELARGVRIIDLYSDHYDTQVINF